MKHIDERKGQSYRMMYSLNQKTEMEMNRRCGTETAQALNDGDDRKVPETEEDGEEDRRYSKKQLY